MIVSVKILLLAIIFVVSGGSLFFESFKKNWFLVSLATVVTIASTFYLGRSIYDDLVSDVRASFSDAGSADTSDRERSSPEPILPVEEGLSEEGTEVRLSKNVGFTVATTEDERIVIDTVDRQLEMNGFALRVGDNIVKAGSKRINSRAELVGILNLASSEGGTSVPLEVLRDGNTWLVKLGFGEAQPTNSESRSFTFLGMKVLNNGNQRVVVDEIDEGSFAYEQGIRVGDQFQRVGTSRIRTVSDLERSLEALQSRGRNSFFVTVKNGDVSDLVTLMFNEGN